MNSSEAKPSNAGNARSFKPFAWVAGSLIAIVGLLQALMAEGWRDQVIAGWLMFATGLIVMPPIRDRVRGWWRWTRPVWIPVVFAAAMIVGAQLVGSQFAPSGAELARLRSDAVVRAQRLLTQGELGRARFQLRRFRGQPDPDGHVAATLQRIDQAERDLAASRTHEDAQRAEEKASEGRAPARRRQQEQRAEARRTSALRAEARAQTAILAALQARMNDPTSLVIVGQRILPENLPDGTPILRGYIVYRGTNAFGGVVTEQAILNLSPDGQRVMTVHTFPNGTF